MASLSGLSSNVGMLGFASGPIGFGRIWVLGRTPGLGRDCVPPSPFPCRQGPSHSVVSDLG